MLVCSKFGACSKMTPGTPAQHETGEANVVVPCFWGVWPKIFDMACHIHRFTDSFLKFPMIFQSNFCISCAVKGDKGKRGRKQLVDIPAMCTRF